MPANEVRFEAVVAEKAFQHSNIQRLQHFEVCQTNARVKWTEKIVPANFIIIEGRLLLHRKSIRDMLNFSIFLDTEWDVLLSKRIFKHMAFKHAAPIEDITNYYMRFVRPMHEKYVEPSKSYSNVMINNYKSELGSLNV